MTFPLCRQRNGTDCGPACLATVAACFGERRSISDLRRFANTSRTGTSVAGLVRAAEKIGFDARGVRTTLAAVRAIPLPAIAHWNDEGRNHFVVVYEVSGGTLSIGDPAVGPRWMTEEQFGERWTGVLLVLEPKSGSKLRVTQYFRNANSSMTSTSRPDA